MTVDLTQDEVDALRSAIPARTGALTKAVAVERDGQTLVHIRCTAAEKRQTEPDTVFAIAYDSIRKGAPGLSDRTCEAIARSIAIKVAYAAKASGEAG